jgi:lipoprotein-releasing system permease protein
LSTPFEIAKKISFHKQKSYTRFIVRLSIAATAISVAAILLTLSIVNGFQESIANKVYHFWGHIRVNTINGAPIDQQTQASYLQHPGIARVTPFINQSAVLAYRQDIEGVIVKGTPSNAPIPFLKQGRTPNQIKEADRNNSILLSDALAKKLNIPLDSNIRLYFLNNGSVQQRKLKVIGLYHSGIEEYDKQFVMVDLQLLQQLNGGSNLIEGYSLELNKGVPIDITNQQIQKKLPDNLVSTSIKDYYPQIFDWIGVQTINRNVTIVILLIIAIVNLLTCLFILMLERVSMIGSLTSMGATTGFIRQVFLYQASFICWMGIAIGTAIGLGLSFLQQYFGCIQLDETAYFIQTLPISIHPMEVIWVILGTAVISYLSFLIPTLWIHKIAPAKAIQFN